MAVRYSTVRESSASSNRVESLNRKDRSVSVMSSSVDERQFEFSFSSKPERRIIQRTNNYFRLIYVNCFISFEEFSAWFDITYLHLDHLNALR